MAGVCQLLLLELPQTAADTCSYFHGINSVNVSKFQMTFWKLESVTKSQWKVFRRLMIKTSIEASIRSELSAGIRPHLYLSQYLVCSVSLSLFLHRCLCRYLPYNICQYTYTYV